MFKTINGGKLPTRGSKYSACIDLYANEDCVISAGETKMIGLGVTIDGDKIVEIAKKSVFDIDMYNEDEILEYFVHGFKERHYLQLMLRSSLGKKGLILPNGVGIIDIDYKDEIKMIIHNPWHGDDINRSGYDEWGTYYIKKGDKIAQITLLEHKSWLLGVESDKDRSGGFGSTLN